MQVGNNVTSSILLVGAVGEIESIYVADALIVIVLGSTFIIGCYFLVWLVVGLVGLLVPTWDGMGDSLVYLLG